MNKVQIVGRLTRDPEVKYTTGENANAIARFSVAVNRRFKNAEGGYDADFINCVAFGKNAEFIEKFFKKGMAIGISGHIQTGNYINKDGIKVYTTDVVVEEPEFVESKKNSNDNNNIPSGTMSSQSSLPNVDDDEDLPFL